MDERFKEIRNLLQEFDHVIRGDPAKDTDGVIARMHQIENDINLLKAVLLKDNAGNRGLQGRTEDLERSVSLLKLTVVGDYAGKTGLEGRVVALENEDKRSERRLKMWVTVITASGVIVGAFIANWTSLMAWVNRAPTDPIEIAIERAKHPKGKPHVAIRKVPIQPESQD